MSNPTKFFLDFKQDILNSINTAMTCEVLSFNPSNCTAKLQPLFMVKDKESPPEKLSVIEDVPVLFQRFKANSTSGTVVDMYPHLETGDVVQVVFNQRAIDDAAEGQLVYPGTIRMFSTHDAVVIGVIKQ